MGEGHKRRSIDEIIEHMTADFQSSDGQYFHLGFTPPPNSVSSHAWTEAFVSAPISTSQIHYQPNHVHPVFSQDGRIQFKAHHQNILPTIQHNVEITPSFFQVQPSPQANAESMTCENHGGGVPYVAPGQPPRPLGGFVPYHRDYNLFDEGQVRLIRVADQSSKSDQWGSSSKPVSGLTTNEQTSPVNDGHVSLDSSPKKTELINSFAGQWVPNPDSPYTHFGNQAGATRNMDVNLPQEVILKCDKSRGNGIVPPEKHKRRSNIDGKAVRPSYSDVLSKTPPNKTHSSPSLINNKCTTTAAGSSSEGKGKGVNGAVLRNKNGGSRKGGLKRQYSSASDEQVVSTANIKSSMTQDAVVGVSNKYGVHIVTSKPCGETIPRRWVSLDDLDCGDEEVNHCGQNDNTVKEPRNLKVDHLDDMEIKFSLTGNASCDYDRVKKGARGLNKTKSGNGIQGFNDDASEPLSSPNASSPGLTTLNNYKASGGGNNSGKNQGAGGAKRPLHINNNLGTSPWAAVNQCGGEKNVVKGTSSVSNVVSAGAASSKNCKACSEERKATSASSSGSGTTKSLGSEGGKNVGGGGTSSRNRGGGCCSGSGGGGGQGAPQPPPPPERSSREPQVGKRGQRNRRREGQAPLVTLCRTARLHVIQWGSIILQALLWFLHLLSDILSLSTHLMWNMGANLWEWLSATSRKVGSAFHDLVSSWLGTGSKGSASKKRSNGVGSLSSKGWLTSWFDRTWRSCTRYCRKIFWRIRSWLRGRGLWWTGGGGHGGDQEWDSDDGDDKDRGPFGGREKGSGRKDGRGESGFHHPESLECNMSLPSTGEEAMKRLLACKGKDPYSILGVTPNCSDDDVKKYYKRQAFLVHPDKNSQPGAEEAFKILVHAFDLIGEPEKRQAYDRRVVETRQAEHAWTEFSDLLSQLQEKIAEAANTIRCTNCGKRHRRVSVQRPCFAARLCSQCKIHHAAREGDIWAESSMLGFLWHYYACMEGGIYDITEWAACQGENLRHLRPNSHNVQYRILLGKRGGNSGPSGSPSSPPGHSSGTNTKSPRSSESPSDPDLDHFLNNLYSGGSGVGGSADNSQRQEQSRKRKGKRKK